MKAPDPAQAPEAAAPDFNAYGDSYREAVQDSIAFSGAPHEFFTQAKARHLIALAERQLGELETLDVIDVGCGVGETDRFLEGRFRELVGVDLAPELLARAAESNSWASYRSYAEDGRIPTDDRSFDLSFAICVLHHVPPPDRERFVAEMARVTKPGGIVAIFEHNPLNPLTRKSVRNCAFDEGVVLLPRRRTKRLLARQGLVPVADPYIVFFTRPGKMRARAERALTRVPAGAQYYVAARREPTSEEAE